MKTLLRVLKYLMGLVLLGLVLVLMLFSMVYLNLFGRLPSKEKMSLIINEEASLVYSGDSIIIGKIFAENRTNIKEEHIPNHLKEALIATEDRRFYSHNGYDGRSYLRVLLKTIVMSDQSGGGGSTITQQLVKNLYGRQYSGFFNIPPKILN